MRRKAGWRPHSDLMWNTMLTCCWTLPCWTLPFRQHIQGGLWRDHGTDLAKRYCATTRHIAIREGWRSKQQQLQLFGSNRSNSRHALSRSNSRHSTGSKLPRELNCSISLQSRDESSNVSTSIGSRGEPRSGAPRRGELSRGEPSCGMLSLPCIRGAAKASSSSRYSPSCTGRAASCPSPVGTSAAAAPPPSPGVATKAAAATPRRRLHSLNAALLVAAA